MLPPVAALHYSVCCSDHFKVYYLPFEINTYNAFDLKTFLAQRHSCLDIKNGGKAYKALLSFIQNTGVATTKVFDERLIRCYITYSDGVIMIDQTGVVSISGGTTLLIRPDDIKSFFETHYPQMDCLIMKTPESRLISKPFVN